MNVGFIGLGRVGLVLALCMERHGGHQVCGYDVSDRPRQILVGETAPPAEEGIAELLNGSRIGMLPSVNDVVARSDLVMVCVQTPHPGGWTGSTPMEAPSDFDYSYLIQAVSEAGKAAAEQDKPITLVVVSTVLPGTCKRELLPLCPPQVRLVYAPSLISLGTVARDFLEPEVVIIGRADPQDAVPYRDALVPLHSFPVQLRAMDFASAELAKMSYNLMTVAKQAVGGTIARLADQCGADADAVVEVLSCGTRRLLSPMYLKAGMPAAGPCHPRDVNALAWLAEDGGPFLPEALAADREDHARWLAGIVRREHERTGLPVAICGPEYKPGVNVTDGSASLLMSRYLSDLAECGSYVETRPELPPGWPPQVFFVGCAHERFTGWAWPPGSVVIDPFGYIPPAEGVTLVTPGRKREA